MPMTLRETAPAAGEQSRAKNQITKAVTRRLMILGGRANPALTTAIAHRLGIEPMEREIKDHANGEPSIMLDETVRGAELWIIQPTSLDPLRSHFELCAMIQTATIAGAAEITVVLPSCMGERQDRKKHGREPITAALVFSQILSAGNVRRVLTLDLHSAQLQCLVADRPADHFYATDPMTAWMRTNWLDTNGGDDLVIVSPDIGGTGRARAFGSRLGRRVAIINKTRSPNGEVETTDLIGDVNGKTAAIVDDMIDTAGTLCAGARFLLNDCGAKRVVAAATYPLLSDPAVERLVASPIDQIVVSDALHIPQEKIDALGERLAIVSVVPLLAEAIRRQFFDEECSDMIGWFHRASP